MFSDDMVEFQKDSPIDSLTTIEIVICQFSWSFFRFLDGQHRWKDTRPINITSNDWTRDHLAKEEGYDHWALGLGLGWSVLTRATIEHKPFSCLEKLFN